VCNCEDNEYIYKEVLGFSEEEFKGLVEIGIAR